MPTLTKTVEALCRTLDNDFSLYRSGNIRIKGRWTNKIAWERAYEKAPSITLTLNGRAYQNPKLVSLKDETLTLAHEGGIAKIDVGDLNANEKQQAATVLKIDPTLLAPPPAPVASPPMTAPAPEPAVVVQPKALPEETCSRVHPCCQHSLRGKL